MSLKEIRGQEKAVEILKSGIRESRIVHAYLFLGPKGIGKTRAALEFAKLLNCREPLDDACGSCSSCAKIGKLTHPDIFFISRDKGQTQIPIDKIRQLQRRLSLKPFEAQYKVAIIAEAEDMSEEASNCLLKILEEPPDDCVFILTASNRRMLIETIISRCQAIRFKPLTRDEVNNILEQFLQRGAFTNRFGHTIQATELLDALTHLMKELIAFRPDSLARSHGIGRDDRAKEVNNFQGT